MAPFTIFPAIDLRQGQVVRLVEGNPQDQTHYDSDPADTAERWLAAGATWLHVVNLDGAFGEEGPANQSYGLQVAQLAGIPSAVIRAAKKHLFELEAASVARDRQPDLFSAPVALAAEAEPPLNPAFLEKLQALDPDTLTPKQALETLYEIRKLLDA